LPRFAEAHGARKREQGFRYLMGRSLTSTLATLSKEHSPAPQHEAEHPEQ
jgi:hypothetical protein